MASPPFNLDVADPADNAIVSQFPLNERTFRDNTNSYLGIEHDINTGYHKFQILTTTAKNALLSPPTGMFVYDSTLGFGQINTGTSGAPVWTNTGGEITGALKMWPTTSAPTGYLLCNGQAVSRTTYAALFALIGTTFGAGDGSTTFNVPNFTRRVPVGVGGTATGVLGNTIGSTGGEETHTLTTAELPHLSYNLVDPGHAHDYTENGIGSPTYGSGTGGGNATATTTASFTNISISDNNGGGAHDNLQPSLVINFIIKT